jgi:hypothetical protein
MFSAKTSGCPPRSSKARRKSPHLELRFDLRDVFDQVYQIRNGSGVGVGNPQFGWRRTFLAGLTQRF